MLIDTLIIIVVLTCTPDDMTRRTPSCAFDRHETELREASRQAWAKSRNRYAAEIDRLTGANRDLQCEIDGIFNNSPVSRDRKQIDKYLKK